MITYTATSAAEISDFITAETLINGTTPVFRVVEQGVLSIRTAAQVMRAAHNAAEVGADIREHVNTSGQVVFEVHNGASVYARYTAI